MKIFRNLAGIIILLVAVTMGAQVRQRVPAPDDRGDFGSKFFDDLGRLFGRLQQAELDRAFQRAYPIHCSDLISDKGEWKEVAFLNDDRKLGDWHHTSIEEVKRDMVAFVFSGNCMSDQAAVKVATSYPVSESYKQYQEGRLPLTQVVVNDNDPVTALYDRPTATYVFQLPYLYLETRDRTGALYSLNPPQLLSRPEPDVSEEFRCKALSDPELTYRFMICRTKVVDRDPRMEAQKQKQQQQRSAAPQPLGNAAYYILSDGKEASSNVKLSFGDGVEPVTVPASPSERNPDKPDRPLLPPLARTWEAAPAQAKLVDIAGDEFRLRFGSAMWTGRIQKPQLISGGMLSDFAPSSTPDRSKEYCTWQPVQGNQLSADNMVYWLSFKKNEQSVTSATIDIENAAGKHVAALECFFPKNQTPADITVDRFNSITGTHINLEVRGQ